MKAKNEIKKKTQKKNKDLYKKKNYKINLMFFKTKVFDHLIDYSLFYKPHSINLEKLIKSHGYSLKIKSTCPEFRLISNFKKKKEGNPFRSSKSWF